MKSPLLVLLLMIPVTARAADAPRFTGYQGDLNGDGSTDIFVERAPPGATDGSMNSYVLLNTGSGSPVAVVPGEPGYDYYSSLARSLPNPRVIVGFTDLNADGEVDHIIPGSKFFPEAVVFAPGAQADKGRPQGVTILTPQLRTILADLRNWMNDGTYFSRRVDQETRERTQESQTCVRGSDGILVCTWPGFWRVYIPQSPPGGPASPDWQNPPGRNKPQGHGPEGPPNRPWRSEQIDAVMFAGYAETILTADTPSYDDLRRLSDHFRRLFGVPMFGFDSSGAWSEPRYRDDVPHPCTTPQPGTRWEPPVDFPRRSTPPPQSPGTSSLCIKWLITGFLEILGNSLFERYGIPAPGNGHDYFTDNPICTPGEPGCWLGNVACWGRVFHAPGKIGGYGRQVRHGEVSYLSGSPFQFFGLEGRNPIKTAVGAQGGLHPNAIAQITLPGHWMHGSFGLPPRDPWPFCPKAVANAGRGAPPLFCNQVHREPYIGVDGRIWMYTRGTGTGAFDYINELLGRSLMDSLDQMMRESFRNKGGFCPS